MFPKFFGLRTDFSTFAYFPGASPSSSPPRSLPFAATRDRRYLQMVNQLDLRKSFARVAFSSVTADRRLQKGPSTDCITFEGTCYRL